MSAFSNYPEILAPVGNTEMLYAAVRSGTDAVYLGAEDFNARRNAENFNKSTLTDAVQYCHIRGVKVYLTLNTLVSDSEFSSAVELCFFAYNIGIDAIIIADLGLSYHISKILPELPLHASTQMTIHSAEALIPLKKMGFKRVVLAREMSKQEIAAVTKKANELGMETEVFIHGALCMCVSGQCLMSAFLGGRSGNRGLCAGPCRLPFSASEGKTRHDLSLKDLSLLEHIKELKDIGVSSLKIEGRMKRPEYVATVVTATSQMLKYGKIPENLQTMLKSVFSRSGFTYGYFTSDTGKEMFGIRSKDDVMSASAVISKIHELYRKEYSHIPIYSELNLYKDKASELYLNDGTHSIMVYGKPCEKAINKPTDFNFAYECLSKLGNTPYVLKSLVFNSEDNLIIKTSELNKMRRDAVELLNTARASVPFQLTKPVTPPIFKPAVKQLHGFILRLESEDLLPNNTSDIAAIIIPAENITHNEKNGIPIIAELPRYCTDYDFLQNIIKKLKSLNITCISCGNLSHIDIAEKHKFEMFFGFGMNIFSSYSINYAINAGAKSVLLSPEMTLSQIRAVSGDIPTAAVVYGKIPLMMFKNCPVKNVKDCAECKKSGYLYDRKNVRFKINCRSSYRELLNSVPICLSDKLNEINCDYGLLYFTDETKEQTDLILNTFRNRSKPLGNFTRGLYFKGVL